MHRPEDWKRLYLASLGGRSYRDNLLQRDQEAGLAFELGHYAGWTIDNMRAWKPHPLVRDFSMEALAADFDATMRAMFEHWGFTGDRLDHALQIARAHDLGRMSDKQISDDPHIHSRELSKWRSVLTERDLERFARRYPGL
jgi:hypothetical protein